MSESTTETFHVPAFPTEGWRGDAQTFVEIEEAVRDALPSAPRGLQILLAGAAFATTPREAHQVSTGRTFRKLRNWAGYESIADPEELEEHFNFTEQRIAERWGELVSKAANELADFEDLDDQAAEDEFNFLLAPYLTYLLASQPKYLIEEVFGDYNPDKPLDLILQQPPREPIRVEGIHAEPSYTMEEYAEITDTAHRLWQAVDFIGAEVEMWSDSVDEIEEALKNHVAVAVAAPMGSGKSTVMVPEMIKRTLAEGRVPVHRGISNAEGVYGFAEEIITEINNLPAELKVTLILDESISQSKLKEIITEVKPTHDLRVLAIYGGASEVGDIQSNLLSFKRQFSAGESVRVFDYSDHDFLISVDSAVAIAKQAGVTEELSQLISDSDFLRIPRVFETLVLGHFRLPDASVVGERGNPSVFLGLAKYYQYILRHSKSRAIRPTASNIHTLEELRLGLTEPIRTSGGLNINAVERMFVSTGAFNWRRYQAYAELCNRLGLEATDYEDLAMLDRRSVLYDNSHSRTDS